MKNFCTKSGKLCEHGNEPYDSRKSRKYFFSPAEEGFCSMDLVDIWYDIYLLAVIGLTPGGSNTVHIYTQTIHRTTQLTTLVGKLSGIRTQSGQTKISDEQTCKNYRLIGKSAGRTHLWELYPGICLTTEENHGNRGSQRVLVSTMNTEYTERNIDNNKNT